MPVTIHYLKTDGTTATTTMNIDFKTVHPNYAPYDKQHLQQDRYMTLPAF